MSLPSHANDFLEHITHRLITSKKKIKNVEFENDLFHLKRSKIKFWPRSPSTSFPFQTGSSKQFDSSDPRTHQFFWSPGRWTDFTKIFHMSSHTWVKICTSPTKRRKVSGFFVFFMCLMKSHVSSWVHPRVVMAGAPTRTPPGLKADASPCTALRFNVIEAASPQLVEKPRVKIQK